MSKVAFSRPARSAKAPAPLQNGLFELPPGKIAAVATYLEMRKGGAAAQTVPAAEAVFDDLAGEVARYRNLYAAIGERWLWFSRAAYPDADLRRILDDPAVEALALVRDGRDVGLVELDFRQAGQCELAFLGLVPEAIGAGLGQVLIAEALRRAFARPIRRMWLHTCTLDHPRAMGLYRQAGFRPYLRAIEIADDPRLDGRMPRDAAPEVPLL